MASIKIIHHHIQKYIPSLDFDAEVLFELENFFGDYTLMPADICDLVDFLKVQKPVKIFRFCGNDFKECVYQMVDNFPEVLEALGMLRCYKAPKIAWENVENAEIAMGKELSLSGYGWKPDAWTAMEGDYSFCEMVALVLFD